MRDFNNSGVFNVNGDVVVGDGNEVGKPFIQCSNEELLLERRFRKENLRREFKAKSKRVICTAILIMVCVFCFAGYEFYKGNSKLSMWILELTSIVLTFLGLKTVLTPNTYEKFEHRDIEAINIILKSRRVE
ncbi:hypothetical protein [Maridesulfovibrio sp.]|uniref:hypothetical protein n=1 Tax=Maridesulfovibrio sp. TaxID=2795000 RepID=UPI002A18C78C|nr:hypothetical protein [Maridesulfovibrio sp.]